MHPRTINQILSDPETLDIGNAAEAVRENQRLSAKRDKPKSANNSRKAHADWLARQAKTELLRQKLRDSWNKHKKV